MTYTPPRKRLFNGKKRNVSIGLPEDMIKFFKALADDGGLTFTDVITDALDQMAEEMAPVDKAKKTVKKNV